MTKKEKLFAEFLFLTEFELVKHEDGYGLRDLQEVNLGNIESDRFRNGAEILDRMGIYINDYILEDLGENIPLKDYYSCEQWWKFWCKHHNNREVRELKNTFQYCWLITHPNGINLDRVFKGA